MWMKYIFSEKASTIFPFDFSSSFFSQNIHKVFDSCIQFGFCPVTEPTHEIFGIFDIPSYIGYKTLYTIALTKSCKMDLYFPPLIQAHTEHRHKAISPWSIILKVMNSGGLYGKALQHIPSHFIGDYCSHHLYLEWLQTITSLLNKEKHYYCLE